MSIAAESGHDEDSSHLLAILAVAQTMFEPRSSMYADPKNTVHPGLLWVQAQTAAVEEDRRFEILAVSEADCTAFD